MNTEKACEKINRDLSEVMSNYLVVGRLENGDPVARMSIRTQEEADFVNAVLRAIVNAGGVKPPAPETSVILSERFEFSYGFN